VSQKGKGERISDGYPSDLDGYHPANPLIPFSRAPEKSNFRRIRRQQPQVLLKSAKVFTGTHFDTWNPWRSNQQSAISHSAKAGPRFLFAHFVLSQG
jgi:hypothetical protein